MVLKEYTILHLGENNLFNNSRERDLRTQLAASLDVLQMNNQV
jgi:hypothetical protein